MRSFLIFVVGALTGGAAAIVLAGGVFTGLGAGAGIVTGLKAGSCLTAEAAKEKGYITADQIDELLSAAAAQISSQQVAEDASFVGGNAECQKVLSELKAATGKSQ